MIAWWRWLLAAAFLAVLLAPVAVHVRRVRRRDAEIAADRARDGEQLPLSPAGVELADQCEAWLLARRGEVLLDRLAPEMPPAATQQARWVALNVDRRWAR